MRTKHPPKTHKLLIAKHKWEAVNENHLVNMSLYPTFFSFIPFYKSNLTFLFVFSLVN